MPRKITISDKQHPEKVVVVCLFLNNSNSQPEVSGLIRFARGLVAALLRAMLSNYMLRSPSEMNTKLLTYNA
jgi:hypothetical protein